ncbi:MAG TPA: glycosyl hydrolase family 28-related protein [Acidimicrobiales bacterium]|nr:glycosyl hydrolase family 28-related protein [Acidimicrobiales bacterium]
MLLPVAYWLGRDGESTSAPSPSRSPSQAPASDPSEAPSSWANVQTFGATPDDDVDDTAAIQKAIDSKRFPAEDYKVKGGTVFFPKGHYKVEKPLVADRSVSLTLLGEGGQVAGFENPPASLLTYTGAGSEPFFSARSTAGFTVRNMGVRYNNKGFTGDLFDFSHTEPFDTSPDTSYVMIDNSLIAGEYPVNSARSLLSFFDAITSTVRDSHLAWAQRGIDGKRAPGYGFSNGIRIDSNAFDNLRVGAITNPGQSWVITSNVFEAINILEGASLSRAVYDELPERSPGDASTISGLKFSGNWLGDATLSVHDVWITSEKSRFIGAEITGNFFGGGNVGIRLNTYVEGISISGNYFEAAVAAIDLGPVPGNGINIAGNSIHAPTPIANADNGSQNLNITGNRR